MNMARARKRWNKIERFLDHLVKLEKQGSINLAVPCILNAYNERSRIQNRKAHGLAPKSHRISRRSKKGWTR